jgi:hypothetical protein
MIKSLLAKVRKLFETTTEEVAVITTQVEQKVEELIVEAVVQEVKEVVEVVKTPVQKLSKAKVEKKPRKPKSAKVQK